MSRALGMSSMGTQCPGRALGMASIGLFCGLSGVLYVHSSSHLHAATSPTFSLAYELAVQSAQHGHTASSPAFGYNLTIQAGLHAHSASPAGVEPHIGVASSVHGLISTVPDLEQLHILSTDDALHGLTSTHVIVYDIQGFACPPQWVVVEPENRVEGVDFELRMAGVLAEERIENANDEIINIYVEEETRLTMLDSENRITQVEEELRITQVPNGSCR